MTKKKTLLIYVLLHLFFIQILCSFYSLILISNLLEIIVLVGMAGISAMLYHEKSEDIFQFAVLGSIFIIIWFGGVIQKATIKGNMALIFLGEICATITIICIVFSIVKKKNADFIRKKIYDMLPLIFLCVIFIFMSVGSLHEMPIFDSGAYYSWSICKLASNFDFTFHNIFDYCLASHLSVGYGIFALIGELICPFNAVGIHFVNVVLATISICCFYGIISSWDRNILPINKLMATAIYAFSPYILGLIGTVNIDVPGIYFLCIFLYCYYNEYSVAMKSRFRRNGNQQTGSRNHQN